MHISMCVCVCVCDIYTYIYNYLHAKVGLDAYAHLMDTYAHLLDTYTHPRHADWHVDAANADAANANRTLLSHSFANIHRAPLTLTLHT